MIQAEIFDFLKSLKENNNKEWFQANKKVYENHKQDFNHFVELVIHTINKFDKSVAGLEPKNCTYRINRDIRFSNDKSPYKTNMGAFIVPGGKNSGMAGYYIHFEPGSSFLSGGIYMPSSPALKAIRNEILDNYDEFLSIINHKDFKKHFGGELWGEKLKTRPVGFPEGFEGMEYLKFKHYTVLKEKKDKEMVHPDFIHEVEEAFKALYPLNRFLNQAVRDSLSA
jgi:uncharacterized protein (TIGR02453 family)